MKVIKNYSSEVRLKQMLDKEKYFKIKVKIRGILRKTWYMKQWKQWEKMSKVRKKVQWRKKIRYRLWKTKDVVKIVEETNLYD